MTKVDATIKVGDKDFGIEFDDFVRYDVSPAESMKRRFEMILTLSKHIEKKVIQELGLDFELYLEYKIMKDREEDKQ